MFWVCSFHSLCWSVTVYIVERLFIYLCLCVYVWVFVFVFGCVSVYMKECVCLGGDMVVLMLLIVFCLDLKWGGQFYLNFYTCDSAVALCIPHQSLQLLLAIKQMFVLVHRTLNIFVAKTNNVCIFSVNVQVPWSGQRWFACKFLPKCSRFIV